MCPDADWGPVVVRLRPPSPTVTPSSGRRGEWVKLEEVVDGYGSRVPPHSRTPLRPPGHRKRCSLLRATP